MARKNPYATTLVLGSLVLAAAAGVVWSNRRIPSSVRDERRERVLRAFRRDRVNAIEITGRDGAFTLTKREGHWRVTSAGHSWEADETEAERLLTEAEYAQPQRRVTLEGTNRERYGLTHPRARVTLRETEGASVSFAVGGDVAEEEAAYVEVEGAGAVVTRAFANAFLQDATALRDRGLSGVEPSHTTRVELEGSGSHTVFVRENGQWLLREPALGRAARLRIETLLNDLRDLRATRFLADEATDAQLAGWGLAPAQRSVRATLERGTVVQWRLGNACPGHDDELTVVRGEGRTVACVARSVLDAMALPAEQYRDDRLLWARPDEVDRVTIRAPSGEFTLRRENTSWRLDGATGETDEESIDAWLSALGNYSVERRLEAPESAAAHGLAPVTWWLELRRSGVESLERLNVGAPDADGMYVQRGGEHDVLLFDPVTAEQLRIDAARFRSRALVHDVPDQLTTLLTESSEFTDEAQSTAGHWTLTRPASLEADPAVLRTEGNRLASLSAERWVTLTPEPRHGLESPRLRVVARFEGAPPAAENADAGADAAAVPRVREYTLRVGAEATGGGYYASLAERPGVFVLSAEVYRELAVPHADRNVLELDRARVTALELTRPLATGTGSERVRLRRDGTNWRTDAGVAVDRVQVGSLLEHLALVRAPRVFGYGAAPAEAALGRYELAVTVAGEPGADGGAGVERTLRVRIGAEFGEGSEAGYYAEVPGRAVRTSVPRETVEALRAFRVGAGT